MTINLVPSVANYCVMGSPVAHSLSPQIHAAFAAQCGHIIHYQAIPVEHGQFKDTVMEFQAQGGQGLNVTLPLKGDAWRIADQTSDCAQRAMAVNTISFDHNGAIIGDNTDGIGWIRDVTHNHHFTIKDKRILLLGAGGAIRGILGPLLDEQPAKVLIANRTPERARQLVKQFGHQGGLSESRFDDLPPAKDFDMIVNGTSASLQDKLPPLPYTRLDGLFCHDLAYAKTPTRFVAWATAQGATMAIDGMGMLVEQAAESYRIWHGVRPQTSGLIRVLKTSL